MTKWGNHEQIVYDNNFTIKELKMNIDKYELWEPVFDASSDIYFYDLNFNGEILNILLKKLEDSNRVLSIKFKGVLGYRVVKESGRIKTTHEISTFRGFRISEDSEFLRWFKNESADIFEDTALKHYLICNIDNIIDVISGFPVVADWIFIK